MKEILNNQYKNLFLWSPFIMALGAVLYFTMHSEPNFQFPILITALSGLIIYKHKNIFITAIALFLFGFFYSVSYTNIIDTPQIYASHKAHYIYGTVQDIDFMTDNTRITLKIPANQINSKYSGDKHALVRLSFNKDSDIPNINDTISGNIMLFHPSAAYVPDDFDFARWAYFNKLSGIGFVKDYKIKSDTSNSENLRTKIHNKSNSVLTDALVLGYKNTIPKSESNIWKAVGVGHIWSISGFHMTLVGGWLFAIFYLLFRCISPITKRMPAKYPAMICAWCGLLFYLGISGFSVATVRAFLMTTLIFMAFIFGRNLLSLRTAVLVFFIIFLINPFYVMHAGFQLSFAAVFGLLWFFDKSEYQKRNRINHIGHKIYSALMTAVVAGVFTLPFIIAHFGYIPLYSLIGNLVILPIFSVAIMPMIMIGTMFAYFGFHGLNNATYDIYTFALYLAESITKLPHATIAMPHMSSLVLGLCIIGLLCIILIVRPDSKNLFIRNINYIIGFVFIASAIIIYAKPQKPLFYSTYDNELVGFVENGNIHFNKARSSKHFFAFGSWRTFNDESTTDKIEQKKCPKGLCKYQTPNWNLVYMQSIKTVIDNINTVCRDESVDFIVSPVSIRAPKCHAKVLTGGMVIYPSGKIRKVSNHRLWHKGL